jgi:hypothetical protein
MKGHVSWHDKDYNPSATAHGKASGAVHTYAFANVDMKAALGELAFL